MYSEFNIETTTIPVSLHGDLEHIEQFSIKEIEDMFMFSYMPYLCCYNNNVDKSIKHAYNKAKSKRLLTQHSIWLGKLHHQDIQLQILPPIAICWINDIIGYGVVATHDIPAWTFIGEYVGILRKRRAVFLDENDYCFRYPMPGLSLRYLTIDSWKQGNFTRFINHNETPNMESIGVFYDGMYRIIIRTIQDVSRGEELTYHYGPLYWKHRKNKF